MTKGTLNMERPETKKIQEFRAYLILIREPVWYSTVIHLNRVSQSSENEIILCAQEVTNVYTYYGNSCSLTIPRLDSFDFF